MDIGDDAESDVPAGLPNDGEVRNLDVFCLICDDAERGAPASTATVTGQSKTV